MTSAKKAIELIKKMKEEELLIAMVMYVYFLEALKYIQNYIKFLNGILSLLVTGGFERKEIQTIVYLISYVTQELYLDNNFNDWKKWWKKDLFLKNSFNSVR